MTNKIEKRIRLRAPIHRVWTALTDATEFGAWFGVTLDGPFVVGKVTTGKLTNQGCTHMRWWSTVEEMTPPSRFVFTWPHPSNPAASDSVLAQAPTTRVEFDLEEVGSETVLSVVESGFDALPPEQRSTVMRQNEHGWTEQMKSISAYVS